MTLDELRARDAELVAELQALANESTARSLDEIEDSRFNEIEAEIGTVRSQIERLERVAEIARTAPAATVTPEAPSFTVNTRGSENPLDLNELSFNTTAAEMRSRVITAVERGLTEVDDTRSEALVKSLERYDNARGDLARHALVTASDTYRAAFVKMSTGNGHLMTAEESSALETARAASLTDNAGGYAVPVVVDPTIVYSGDGAANPFRSIATIKRGVTDEIKVNSAGAVSASWDGEAAQVSDDAPTVAQTTIKAHKAQAFVPFSIEISQDWVGLEAEMYALILEGKDELEATAFATGAGDGSNLPFGIVTALDANASSEVAMATAGSFAVADVYTARQALPQRYRSKAVWVMSDAYMDRIRQFGTSNNYHGFTVDLSANGLSVVLGRPVYESSAMTTALASGSVQNAIVYGDFSNYVIFDRIGLSVEFVPHLFGANGRPTGQRGFYAHWRVGADSVNDNGFILLQNPSA